MQVERLIEDQIFSPAMIADATPHMLVRDGKCEHVHAYLDRIAAGGYA